MSPTKKNEEGEGDDYLAKRSRNNAAVRRSREKARLKSKETHDRVGGLKQENEMLEERIKLLTKELAFLKDMFLAHADKKHGMSVDDLELRTLLQEDPFPDSEVPR